MSLHPSRLLYEDDHLLVVNKRSGELVVRGKGRMDTLPLLDFLKAQFPTLHPLHRLDFETSGVVFFSKGTRALRAVIATKFAGWQKTYRALVLDVIKSNHGTIDLPLPARSSHGTVDAHTSYRVLERFVGSTYVEATMERGQFHQIRRHFAAIGHPLLLDDVHGQVKYNRLFSKEFSYWRFFLHASSVVCSHPVTHEPLHIHAPLPSQFTDVLDSLRQRQ